MWVFVLTVQDCIKVVRVSCECLYWLFRVVLRCWQLHVSVFIDCSWLYWGVDSFMWVLVLTVQGCIKVLTASCECFYWLFRVVWSCQHLNTTLNSQYKHSHETLTTLIPSWTVNASTHMIWRRQTSPFHYDSNHVSACIDCSGLY